MLKNSKNIIFTNFTVSIVIVTICVDILYFAFSYNALKTLVEEMLYNISRQGIIAVESNMENEIELAKALSSTREVKNEHVAFEDKFRILREMMGYDTTNTFYFIDRTGMAHTSKGTMINLSKYGFIKKCLKGESYISKPMELASGEWVSIVAVPYLNEHNGNVLKLLLKEIYIPAKL